MVSDVDGEGHGVAVGDSGDLQHPTPLADQRKDLELDQYASGEYGGHVLAGRPVVLVGNISIQ